MDRLILLIGIAIIMGSIGGRLFARLGIPQVVGYILIGIVGIVVGGTMTHVVSPEDVRTLRPASLIALAIIGFNVGGELTKETFRKYGSKFLIVLLWEGMTAAVLVTLLAGLATCPWGGIAHLSLSEILARGNWPLAILLGAIASATAPAATVDVLWEYRTRGILTTTVLAIVALDDGLALVLYGIASSVVDLLVGKQATSLLKTISQPVYHLFGSGVLGAAVGAAFAMAFRRLRSREVILPICVGGLLSIIGISNYLDLDLILTSMMAGVVLVNLEPNRSREAFDQVSRFALPIYVLFFVLVGARLQLKTMAGWMAALAFVYVVGRTAGKFFGAYLGSRIARMPVQIQKYLGWCLFSQAGVAIGLAIVASHKVPHETAQAIILIITATTFLVQIIGPPSVKFAVVQAGEVGRDVREEDLLGSLSVKDIMEANPPVLRPEAPLSEILRIAAASDSLYFPVVDHESRFLGIIPFPDLKRIFALQDLDPLVLAYDLVTEKVAMTHPDTRLHEAMERMKEEDVEVLAVVREKGKDHPELVGMLEMSQAQKALRREIVRRRADAS
jgi:Kef-type K+ transport system membrane component KefB/CBS domain-containing protein